MELKWIFYELNKISGKLVICGWNQTETLLFSKGKTYFFKYAKDRGFILRKLRDSLANFHTKGVSSILGRRFEI
jgi:hypothetical protein